MSFFPVDRDILSSSLWAEGTPEQVKVWFYLLLEANPRTGIVPDADPAIALRCGLPLSVTVAALDWLASPDTFSRTKDYDGRRIERLPGGGVRLLNYLTRQQKDHSTPRVKRWREMKRCNGVSPLQTTVKRPPTVTGTTDKDKDTDTTEVRKEADPPSLPPADRVERSIKASTDALRTRLYALVAEMEREDPEKNDPTELMRLVTAYDKPDGTRIRGVVNAALLSHERLERSIADAEALLAEWRAERGSKHRPD